MTDLVKLQVKMRAAGVISQTAKKANLSTCGFNRHKSVPSNVGNIVDSFVDEGYGRSPHSRFVAHRSVGFDEMGHVRSVYAYLVVPVRKTAGVECVADVLTARRINAADQQIPAILSQFPPWVRRILRDSSLVALLRQAIQDGLGKWPILDVVL
jgi:hypothetical protein